MTSSTRKWWMPVADRGRLLALSRRWEGDWISLLLLTALLVLLTVHAVGVCLDFIGSIHYPLELDYGEGIVWQQAALIPGPHMYSRSQVLPFIVFHYPPLYYLIARAATWIEPDFLAAGRLVSTLSTVLIGFFVAQLVLVAARRSREPVAWRDLGIATVAGLLVLCLHGVRIWGMLMRVDMLAIALSMAGLLLGAWSDGRFWGTLGALLLCVASMFTKQTSFSAGITVFLIALLRNPRAALGAATIAAAVGIGGVALMQWSTGNGFLLNIIAGNVNRMLPRHAYWAVRPERSSFIPIGLMLGAFVVLGREVFPAAPRFRWTAVLQNIRALREAGPGTTCRAMALIYFALATGTLIFVLKSGSAFNYLLEWLSIGCALIGIFLIDLARWGAGYRNWFRGAVALLIVFIAHAPVRGGALSTSAHEIEQQAALVKRIAAAKKPVASDDMTLLMRAGKPVIFEPAIVTELAAMGRWDETPLVQMIRRCDFAFMITIAEARQIRSPAVDAEMRKAYPHVERIGILAVREPAPGSCEGSPQSDGAPAAR